MTKTTAKLTPANENPWYVLMTLYGEQKGEEVDWELHKANRDSWNTLIQSISGSMAERASKVIVGLPPRDKWRNVHEQIANQWRNQYEERTNCPWPELFDYRESPCDLSNHSFHKRVCLDGFFMPKGAIFDRSTFAKDLSSRNAFWGNLVSLIDSTALKGVSFAGTKFEDVITARRLKVSEALDLAGAEVSSFVDLAEVEIGQECDLREFQVGGELRCGKLIGGQASKFSKLSVKGEADFDRATFKSLTFSAAQFADYVGFYKTDFGVYASFLGTRFEGVCDFRHAIFRGKVDFAGALFSNFAKFQNAEFGVPEGSCNLKEAEYPRADFTDCQFLYPVSFRDAKFLSTFPILHSSQLHPRSDFTANDANWCTQPLQDIGEAKESCATIRHVIAKQGQSEEEHFFFRREMHFASQIGGWWRRLPYRLYGVFSNYGESIGRPVRALAEVFGFGAIILFGHLLASKGLFASLGLALSLSFSNLLPLFGFGRTYLRDTLLELPWYLQVLSAAQTVFALPLLFFLGLGLRKRFRLR